MMNTHQRGMTIDKLELLNIVNLTKTFRIRKGTMGFSQEGRLAAVDSVSLSFELGKTTAIVGESGSGKTTLGECTLLLTRPDSGSIVYKGTDLTKLSGKELDAARKGMQVVFQDPNSSLNPRMRIRETLCEPLKDNEDIDQAAKALASVGLTAEAMDRFPLQLSSGQRQRVAIARALVSEPDVMVLDEPTSSLDVSVQLQVLNLLRNLQLEYRISYMFITHNMAVAKYMSHFVAVMFGGRIVEHGPAREVVEKPKHPYTKALLSSIPQIGKRSDYVLKEKTEDMLVASTGCRYRFRCLHATEKCLEEPSLLDAHSGRTVRCHYFKELDLE